MELTRANYHSLEANLHYMSNSLYGKFVECESAAVGYLSGEWVEETPTAFLIGSYVHAWSEGRLREWISEHPECFKKDGTLKADFQHANTMIETLKNDPLCMYTLQGQKEVIMTAEFAGAPWKAMMDVYNQERRRIVDLKTTKSIADHVWNDAQGKKVNFLEMYNYPRAAALYCDIERRVNGREPGDWMDYFVVAVSKQDYPDKEVIDMIDPQRYKYELELIEIAMPRILKVKAGILEPMRCGECDYCRSTKRLTGAIHYMAI